MSRSLRTSAKAPDGKIYHKSISLKNYETEEEAQAFLKEWRDGIKDKKPTTKFSAEESRGISPKKQVESYRQIYRTKRQKEGSDDGIMPSGKFKLNIDYTTGSTFLLLGASKVGKTNLMKYIFENYYSDRKDYISILFAANRQSDVYDSVDKKVIKTHIFQAELVKSMVKLQRGTNNKYNFLLMFDDIVDHSTKDSETMKKLITSYRNSKISSIISIQASHLVNRSNRGNLNYITFHSFRDDSQIQDVMKEFIGSRPPFKNLKMDDKVDLYRKLVSDYHFLFLDTIKDIFVRTTVPFNY